MLDIRGATELRERDIAPLSSSSSACLAASGLRATVLHATRLGHQSLDVCQATGVEVQRRRNRQNDSEAVALRVSKNATPSRVLPRPLGLGSTGRMKFNASRREPNTWTSGVGRSRRRIQQLMWDDAWMRYVGPSSPSTVTTTLR